MSGNLLPEKPFLVNYLSPARAATLYDLAAQPPFLYAERMHMCGEVFRPEGWNFAVEKIFSPIQSRTYRIH